MQNIKFNYRSHILLCTCNGEGYIYSQIESLIHQSKSIDYIHVYDFNSSDRTIEEVERTRNTLVNRSSVILNITKVRETPGVNKSFLYALKDLSYKIESSDYIFLCDQDDVWLPSKNEMIYNILKSEPNLKSPLLLHHDVYVVDSDLGELKDSYYDDAQRRLLNSGHAFNHYFGLVVGHTVCMDYAAAQILSKLDHDNAILMYDWYWSSLIEKLGFKYFLDKPLSKYRQHGSNLIGAQKYGGSKKFSFVAVLDHTNNVANQIILMRQIEKRLSVDGHWVFLTTISQYLYLIFGLKNIKILTLRILIDGQIIKNICIQFLGKIIKK